MKRVLVSWSSGKDSAWLLHVLRQSEDVQIVGLLTTFNESANRVAMHGVRHSLVERQSRAVGVPLIRVMLPSPCSNAEYEQRINYFVEQQVGNGVTHFAFGDLFLEEIRDYRIRQFSGSGLEPIFPIWCGRGQTPELAHKMISAGLRAVLTCVDSRRLSPEFAGREFDQQLLDDLPDGIDPCGENGEFHSFCYSGPHMDCPIPVQVGRRHDTEPFVFADVFDSTTADNGATEDVTPAKQ